MSAAGRATFNNNVVVTDGNSLIAGSGDDLQIYYNGTNGEIDVSSGGLTLDVAGNITFDADGDHTIFAYGASGEVGRITNSSQNMVITSLVSDKDIQFAGNDNGSTITALTLDMSEAGKATFNDAVVVDTLELAVGGGVAGLGPVDVSTSAIDITAANDYGTLTIIAGNVSGNIFSDLVFWATTMGATVINNGTVSGSPQTRTYTVVSSKLKLAMASGTYSVSSTSFVGSL
jgi:hypothetical protein